MSAEQFQRYSLVDCEITTHQPYGVVFRAPDGTLGFVDRADISDSPITPEQWPPVGQRLTGVVLGSTRGEKLRVSLRPSDVAFVGSVDDPARAFAEWTRIREEGFRGPKERDAFFSSPEAPPVLKWALRQRSASADRGRVIEVLSQAPEHLQIEVNGND